MARATSHQSSTSHALSDRTGQIFAQRAAAAAAVDAVVRAPPESDQAGSVTLLFAASHATVTYWQLK